MCAMNVLQWYGKHWWNVPYIMQAVRVTVTSVWQAQQFWYHYGKYPIDSGVTIPIAAGF